MRFLILKSKSVCYNSTYYFAECLAHALEKSGHECVIFKLHGKSLAELQAVTKEHFDAVIDFNSKVPQGLDDDTMTYYLDEFDAPFFNYILDHPLYQHDNLKEPLKNYHVICLDCDHAEYIRRYYPNIRSVLVLPLGAMPVEPLPVIPYKKRHYDLLFTGTYMSPKNVLEIIDSSNEGLASDMHKMIDVLKSDFSLRCDEVFSMLLAQKEKVLPPPVFAKYMQLYFLVDTYITAYVRDMAVRALAQSGIRVDIFGYGWEKFECAGRENLRFHGICEFQDTFSKMADAKAVLNIMPWFKNGIHDRIFSAMANGALAISDESTMLSAHFPADTGLISYSLKDMNGMVKKVQDFLANPASYEKNAENGRAFVLANDTWEQRAAVLAEKVRELSQS